MNCFYHQVTLANTRCHVCSRPLCPACDHRVKAFTYCQDCIVSGVDSLHNRSVKMPMSQMKSPAAAAFMGLIPGLGAVYNGTIVRALVHFAVTAGLWQLDDIFDSSLFMWSGIGFYAYSIYDAFQVAKRINFGEDFSAAEESLKKQLQEKTKIWGAGLIGLGVLTIASWVLPNSFMNGLWPVLFIGLGIYFATMYQRKPKARITNQLAPEMQQELPPQPVINFDPIAHDYTQAETRRFDVR